MPLGPAITEHEQIAITKAFLAGSSIKDLAARYERHPATISKILKPIRYEARRLDVEKYRSDLRVLSYETLKLALARQDSRKSALQAAPIAVQVLKGIGEFDSGQQTSIGVSVTVNMPAGFKPPDDLVIDITPASKQLPGAPQDVVVAAKKD